MKFKNKDIKEFSIKWLGKTLRLKRVNVLQRIFLGAGVNRKGGHGLLVRVRYRDGHIKTIYRLIKIRVKHFPHTYINVPLRMVYPPKRFVGRILKEQRMVERILCYVNKKRFYDFPFILPVNGRVLMPFGVVRIFNGKRKSVHKGIDIKAPMGTPVKSSNSGRVIFVGRLYFGGKSIIIDHGLGVYSIYMHLHRVLVKKGRFVKRGEVIGISGKSGRVTGPHLHFGITVLGERVDPLSAIENHGR